MFRVAARAARPASTAARSAIKPKISATRSFSNTAIVFSDHGPAPPKLFGPGAKAGTVPSAYEQTTGLERLQLLGDIEGISVFDESPLDSSRVGTKKDPILVSSFVRVVLCLCHVVLLLSFRLAFLWSWRPD